MLSILHRHLIQPAWQCKREEMHDWQ
jgi:hypothetical protein